MVVGNVLVERLFEVGRLGECLFDGFDRALLVEGLVRRQQASDEGVPHDGQPLAFGLRSLEVEHLDEQRSGRVAVVDAVGVVPAEPVAPVAGSPVVGVVPPPVGVVVAYEVGFALDIAELHAQVGRSLVFGAREAGVLHLRNDGGDDLLGFFVFPVEGLLVVADDQNAVGHIEGFERREVGLRVVVGVDQVIAVQTRRRGVFLARADRSRKQRDRKVVNGFDGHGFRIFGLLSCAGVQNSFRKRRRSDKNLHGR